MRDSARKMPASPRIKLSEQFLPTLSSPHQDRRRCRRTHLIVSHSLSDVCILTGRGICQVRTTGGGRGREGRRDARSHAASGRASEREREGREGREQGTNPPIVIRHHVQCARSRSRRRSNNERIRKGIKEGIRIPDNATRLLVRPSLNSRC